MVVNDKIQVTNLFQVEKDYSYYYNINLDNLKKQLRSFDGVKKDLEADPFTEHYFNKILSDDLPLDRSIPDSRNEL